MKLSTLSLSLVFLTSSAFAAKTSSFECKAVHWPQSGLKSTEERVRAFRKTPRSKLVQYYFTELSDPKDPTLAKEMGKYLEGTEQNELMQGYFQVIEHSSTPDDGSTGIRALPLQELCKNYQKTLKGK
jgi:hypothetical protein